MIIRIESIQYSYNDRQGSVVLTRCTLESGIISFERDLISGIDHS